MERRDLLANHRVVRRFVNVNLRPVLVLLGHVVVGEDGLDRTLGDARIAIDASIGVDIKTIS